MRPDPWMRAILVAVLIAVPTQALSRSLLSDHDDHNDDDDRRSCMTDRMARNFLAEQGFSNIMLNANRGSWLPFKANSGGRTHLLTLNTCSGQIYGRR